MLRSLFVLSAVLGSLGFGTAAKGPNVLVIMADDQDLHLDSLSVMPNVKDLIIDKGVMYTKHFCTVAWCCPSRVNFFTGKAAHNTNVTGLSPPYGGWGKFVDQGLNADYLPVWLQAAGIKTYYVGKFMNSYTVRNFMTPEYPRGWDDSSMLVDPWTYNYMKSRWTNQRQKRIENHSGTHTTLVNQQKALNILDTIGKAGEQFFMMVAPVAPHAQIAKSSFPPPPPMFKGKFSDAKAPRTPNFNPDIPTGSSWIKAKAKLTTAEIAAGDKMHVHRLENIAGIDHMTKLLLDKLQQHNMLDNTYVIYTSDNGFHIGNHRLKPGKRCGYEEDINIPLMIRGPDVPQGTTTDIHNSHTDMAPTILKMFGIPLRKEFDGSPVAYTSSAIAGSDKHEHINVEFWDGVHYSPTGHVSSNFLSHNGYYFNGTYKSLRLRSGAYSFYYSVWCTHEKEFYDMNADYYQMSNRLGNPPLGQARKYFGRPESQLYNRLDAMLMVLKSCQQDSCRNPWNTLFPHDNVNGLEEAMKPKYDKFFENQPKVRFDHCIGGHIVDAEGPRHVNVFQGGDSTSTKKAGGSSHKAGTSSSHKATKKVTAKKASTKSNSHESTKKVTAKKATTTKKITAHPKSTSSIHQHKPKTAHSYHPQHHASTKKSQAAN